MQKAIFMALICIAPQSFAYSPEQIHGVWECRGNGPASSINFKPNGTYELSISDSYTVGNYSVTEKTLFMMYTDTVDPQNNSSVSFGITKLTDNELRLLLGEETTCKKW